MLMSNIPICYFIVYGGQTSLIKQIHVDMEFLAENVNKAKTFFTLAILPELLAKWYSRDHITFPDIETTKENTNIEETCTCGENKEGVKIECSDSTCVVKSYHLTCLGLTNKPKGKWFCPYCSRKKSRGKKRK